MQFWTDLLLNPIIVIAALVIGTVGEVVKRSVSAKAGDHGWRGLFYVSLPAQPVLFGTALGFIPWLPVPESLHKEGFELAARIGTYAFAGVVCKVGYDSIVSTLRRQLGQAQARASSLPAAPSTAPSEPPPPES